MSQKLLPAGRFVFRNVSLTQDLPLPCTGAARTTHNRVLRPCCLLLAVTLAGIAMPLAIHGQTLFSENFDTDHTANWTVNASAGTHPVNVFFDYSTIGIPSAPNSGGTRRGLKLQANTVGGVFGGVSVSPTGQGFTGNYRLRFDLWLNFNGPLGGGGNGTTQLGGAGIGVTGVTPQWAGGTLEGVWFAGTGEGGTTEDYRAYSATVNNYAPATGVYNAGTTTTPVDARNSAHAYYSSFGGKTAPAAQLASYPQQTGSTPVGTLGFTWLDVAVTKSGNLVSWTVNGVPFATVNAVGITLSTNILLNYFDFNATTSTDPNAPALLFALFDNVRVEVIPAAYIVFGGGGYCPGGSGAVVQLNGSETGVDYLLRTNGVYAGVTVAGTGAGISFANQTAAGTYTVLASNTLSPTTLVMNGSAVVTINSPPAITGGPTPASDAKAPGDTAAFSIGASGLGLTYQWRRDGTNLANGGNILGATTSTLQIGPLQLTDAVGAGHGYTCVVSGTCAPPATSGEATLTVVPPNHWRGDGAANQWDLATANWFGGLFQDGGNTTFDDFGSNNVPVDINTTVSPSWLSVDSTGTYVFSGSGNIAGGGGLTKSGSGELKLATSNSFASTAQVFGGRVTLQNNHALGTTNGATVVGIPGAANSTSLQLDGNGLSVAEPLVLNRWDATFPSTGGALVNLANTNVWSGPVTLAEATVIHSAAGLLTLNCATPVAGPGRATFTGDGDILLQSGVRADVARLDFSGTGTKTLTGTNASSGGMIALGNSRVVASPWSLGSGGLQVVFGSTLEINADGGSVTFGNAFNPSGGKLRVSGGTVSYNGTIEVQLANGCIFETASSSDRLVFDTPIRQLPAGGQIGYITISGPGTIAFNAGLSAAQNGWPGGWLIDGGTVLLNHTSALSQQSVNLFNGATLQTAVNGGVVFAYELSAGNGTFLPGRATLGTGVSNYFDSLRLGGQLRIAPGTNLTAGSTAEAGFDTGRLFANSVLSVENSGGVNARVTIAGGISEDFGTLSVLTKAGSGTLVLRSADPFPYRGGTVVSNGTLVVANTTGSVTGPGDVTVHDSGTLMGNGRIAGSVIIKSGGTLAAGASIGALVISNSLIFEAGATNVVEVNLATATNDFVYGLTNVVYAGTLVVSNVGPQTFTNGAAFKIFDSLAYSGSFAALLPSTPGPGLSWDVTTLATDGILRVQAPNTTPILANPIPDQTNTYGGVFNFTFAANTFSDPDAGQTLVYTASNLPPGISFNGPTLAFSGTPTNVGLYAVTVTATDDGTPPLNTNDTFNIVVDKALLAVSGNNTNRPYGEADPTFTGTLVGVTNSDNLTVTFATIATPSSPPGDYAITPILQDPDSRLGNYSVITNNGTLSILGVVLEFNAAAGSPTLCWPTAAAAFLLEYTDDLTPPVTWHETTNGIITNGPNICLTVTPEAVVTARFYRLHLP